MAGFIDPHIHFPADEVKTASYGRNLLEWLTTSTFVRAALCDATHSARFAKLFFDELLHDREPRTAAAYCSSAQGLADAYFAEAARRKPLMVGGK